MPSGKSKIFSCFVVLLNGEHAVWIDSAAVGALQAIPGFLKVFGYEDLSSALEYGIDVSELFRTIKGWTKTDQLRRVPYSN